jgi:hypothetical protein
MVRYVNLDAMIPREDFEVDKEGAPPSKRLGTELKLTDLEASGIIYHSLRKPDFQRETSSWDAAKVADFIKSFVDGDLIPAIIMWRSPKTGNLFVIDGAHRLSGLIAWIHDDYGDAVLSRPFFQHMMESAQQKAADETRQRIAAEVGTYGLLKQYALKPDAAPDSRALLRGRNMGAFNITLQWVEGDAQSAENSFFKINQSAARIDDTELALIKSRRKPNAIVTRALIRAGTGHKYWSSFGTEIKTEIEKISKRVYTSLFLPVLEYPIKTLDLPAADRGYTAGSVAMIFDLANYLSGSPDGALVDDATGDATLKLLSRVEHAASRVFGPDPSSLGLHPGVYCYGATGRFQSTAFLAAIAFVQELEKREAFFKFTKHRKQFEEFLLRYRYFVNQINKNYSRAGVALRPVSRMYEIVLEGVSRGESDDEIINTIRSEKSLNTVKVATDDDRKYGRNFTRETKNAAFLRDALAKELECAICGARLHFKAISHDHKVRIADGGTGDPANSQLTHPYCNTGYKERVEHEARGAAAIAEARPLLD